MNAPLPQRIHDLEMPDIGLPGGITAREADRRLLGLAGPDAQDTTHFDTVRFPPPEWASKVMQKAMADGALAYTPYSGDAKVLSQVAETVSRFLGIPVDPTHNIVLTPGTQGALFCSFSSLTPKGGSVAVIDPEYFFDQRMISFLGGTPRHVHLDVSGETPKLDLEALEATFRDDGTRAFVFSNPHNPTGAILPRDTLEKIAKLAQQYDVTVIADELYSRLLHKDANGKPAEFNHICSLPGMAERTITLLGPSKTESLSGFRLGVAVVPTALKPRMENVLAITALRAPAYSQQLLPYWLRDDNDWLEGRLGDFTALRDTTLSRLRELPWLKVRQQEGTAYVWPDVSALGTAPQEVAEALLTKANVFVNPGYQFGPNSFGYFRMCYARDEETWDKALTRIVDVLADLAKSRGL